MDYASQLALFSKMAEEKGLVNSLEGKLSAIARSTGNIYITPSHKAKCLLTPEQVCVVVPDSTQIGIAEKKHLNNFFIGRRMWPDRICVRSSIVIVRT